jgi:hypothetical protein
MRFVDTLRAVLFLERKPSARLWSLQKVSEHLTIIQENSRDLRKLSHRLLPAEPAPGCLLLLHDKQHPAALGRAQHHTPAVCPWGSALIPASLHHSISITGKTRLFARKEMRKGPREMLLEMKKSDC